MSYRSLKRVLGETNLERKTRWLFGFSLFLLIAGTFWWYGSRSEYLVYENMRTAASILVEPALLREHAELFGDTGEAVSEEEKELRKYWQEYWELGKDYEWKVLNPRSLKPEKHPETEDDRAAIAKFLKQEPFSEPPENERGRVLNQDNYYDQWVGRDYYFYQPIWAHNQQCIGCHVSKGLSGMAMAGKAPPGAKKLEYGDLLGVVRIAVEDSTIRRAVNWNRAILITAGLVTWFLAMLAAYLIVRYIILKPLAHLRQVSDEVTRGNMQARAEIQTGDEFEELAKAFNKMLRHQMDAQTELRAANATLDGKVDELAQLNMRLYEMNRLKSDFLATMSHELRTPLNSIIGFSDVLSSIKSLDDKQRRYVQNIQKSGRMLLDMINDILDLAKIESGKMEVRLVEFRIEQVIAAQCDMARPLAERKNIDLECQIEPDLPELFQDQGKVQQILNNLLSNAIKFTPEGGRIVIGARRGQHDTLLLSVADTGVGIAEQDQTSIFEKFRQGASALSGGDAMTREHSGTGLGLSIVKELCKLLGGEVYLQSELGKGSTFTVQLPIARADQPKFDSPLDENLDELLRPRREELQRALTD